MKKNTKLKILELKKSVRMGECKYYQWINKRGCL
jgi:hypothetical protein